MHEVKQHDGTPLEQRSIIAKSSWVLGFNLISIPLGFGENCVSIAYDHLQALLGGHHPPGRHNIYFTGFLYRYGVEVYNALLSSTSIIKTPRHVTTTIRTTETLFIPQTTKALPKLTASPSTSPIRYLFRCIGVTLDCVLLNPCCLNRYLLIWDGQPKLTRYERF